MAAGQAAVPHRREEPASYRPTATAKKHGPLQSRAGRQIRDVGRGYALPFVTPPETVLILIDARFSPCSPRSTAPPACRRARSIRGRDDSSLAEPARFRRFSFSFGFSPTRTSSTASGRCLAFIPAYRHDGRAATRPSRILYVVKRGLEKFPCPGRVPRPSHVETPPITRHIRRCLLKPQRIRRVAMSYRAQMFSRFLPLSVHASRSNLRGALSAKVSLLPPEAFGLVPPLPPYSECITQYQQRSVGGIRSPREQGGSCELAGASGWWSARAATRSRLSAQIKSSLRVFTNSVRAAKSRKISAVFRYSSASVDGGRTLIMSISPR